MAGDPLGQELRAAVLTVRGKVEWSSKPPRVGLLVPLVIDGRGVTLSRWPRRPILIPLEQVDRFDFLRLAPVEASGFNDYFERLALFTRAGKKVRVSGPVPRRCAQQLNNCLVSIRGTA